MGWRATGASFKAGTYDGPLTKPKGGFAEGFASTLGPGLQNAAKSYADRKAEERAAKRQDERDTLAFEREKELTVLRETLATNRAAATKSSEAEKDTIKLSREATAIAKEFNLSVNQVLPILIGNDGDGSQTRNAITDMIGNNTLTPDAVYTPEPLDPPTPLSTDQLNFGEPVPDTGLSMSLSDKGVADDLEATEPFQIASRGDTVSDVPQPLISEPEALEEGTRVADLSGSLGMPLSSTPLTFGGASAEAPKDAPTTSSQDAQFEAIQRAKIAEMSTDRIQSLLASTPAGPYRTILESSYRGRITDELSGKQDEELAALARTGDAITSEVARGILEAKVEYRNADNSRFLTGVDTVGKALEKRVVIANDPFFNDDPARREKLLAILDEHAEKLRQEEARRSANQKSEPQLYGVLDPNGVVRNTVRMTPTADGFVDDRGQPVTGDNFVWINPDDVQGYISMNNQPKIELVDRMVAVANATRDLTDLAGIVENNPRVTNRFNLAAQDVVSFLGQADSFISDLGIGNDERIPIDEAIRRLDMIRGMGADRKKVAILSLQAAYGIAALNGSSGQALSDKELQANLANIYSTGKAEDVLAGIYLNIRRLTEAGETSRKTTVDSFFGLGRAAETFSNAVWNTPVSDYVSGQLKDEARLVTYQKALSGQIPTAASTTPTVTTTPSTPPPAAIEFLRSNSDDPNILEAFELKYGIPASTFLGGGE